MRSRSSSLPLTRRLRRLLAIDQVVRTLLRINHRGQKSERRLIAPVAHLVERQREPPRLNLGQSERQPLAVGGRVELPSSPVQSPGPDLDEVLVDELPQDAVETLLGDSQNFQKLG